MKTPTLTVLIVLTALLSGCGSSPRIDRVTANSTVIAFGDSLTSGYGAKTNESYPSVLAELLGCRVINAGVPGEMTSEGLQRLPDVLKENDSDLVILCFGGNDMLQKQPRERTKANLREMITLIKESGSDIIMIAVPQPGLFLTAPDFYEELADEHGLPLDSKTIKNILSKRSLKSDSIHPNAQGYKIMAESFLKLIKQSEQK
jgi:lysophospholipase L1-like esterase